MKFPCVSPWLTMFAVAILFAQTACSAEYFDDPVASIISSGGQKLINAVSNLAQVSERPQIETFFKNRLDQLKILQAFDLDQPVGAFLFFPTEGLEPLPLVVIPVKDFKAIRAAVSEKFHVEIKATDDPEFWTIQGKNKVFEIRVTQGYAAISEKRDLLLHLEDLFSLMKHRSEQFDLSIAFRPQAMPAPLRDVALLKMKSEITKDLERKPDESDEEFELHQQMGALVISSLSHIVQETEGVDAGIKIGNGIRIQTEWKAIPNSTLAKTFVELQSETNAFPQNASSAAYVNFSLSLPEPTRELLLHVVALVRKQVAHQLGQKLDPDDRHPVGKVFDTFRATIQHGSLNALMEFRPVGEYFSLITAMSLAEPEGLATSLKAVLPYVESDSKVKSVEFDVIAERTLHIHRLIGTESKQQDREIYGDNLALYIGTDAHAGWFALGGPATLPLLKERSTCEPVPSTTLVEAHVSFYPWIQLAARTNPQDDMLKILQAAFPKDDQDNIHIQLKQTENSILCEANIESGYQRLAGMILTELIRRRDH